MWLAYGHNRVPGVSSAASDFTEAVMSRHKKDPLRALAEPERQELRDCSKRGDGHKIEE
jgi:hypothetical protein